MKKSKSTKRALLASLISLLLCSVMLIGSTFAWFTDSVSSGVNKIVAGNLDVELEYRDAAGEWQPVTTDTKLFPEDALWEPGHTEVVYLRIRNAGTLALKYQFAVTPAEETAFTNALGEKDCKLSKSLVFGKVESENAIEGYKTREDAWKAAGSTQGLDTYTKESKDALLPEREEYVALVVYMPTTVANEANYRGETIPEITLGVALNAFQAPYEKDSFSNDYDLPADPAYDPYAEADKEAAEQGNSYRRADGTYAKIEKMDDQRSFLLDTAWNGEEVTLIQDIGAPKQSSSSRDGDYSNKQSVLDLNGHTYTFGELELKQNYNKTAENSSLVIKNGTMVGSVNFDDILVSYNAMQTVTLDHVNMKWNDPLAWDANKTNYYGLNLCTKTSGSVFSVKDCVLDCNASFYTTANGGDLEPRAIANVTNTVVNGRLHGAGLTMNVEGCTVNGEVYCNASNSSKTTINISDSTINGNAFFSASNSVQQNDVAITNTVINGNLQTSSTGNKIHITLTDVTVTGTLGYNNSSWTIPADKVTIESGNYGFNPTNYLATGSTATYDEATNVWVVTAN